ncbi:Bromo adjacent homology domain-containing 1 protein, partial [Armadillidium nasatum]
RQRMRLPIPTSKKSSPGEQNDVPLQKDEHPSGRSSSLSLPRVVSSSTPTKGSPTKKRSTSAGRDSPSRQGKTPKKSERGRTQRKIPEKASIGAKSKEQRSPGRTPSEGSSPSPKRCRRIPATEQQSNPKGSLTLSTETREQRIARSIESVINSFGNDFTSESPDTRNECLSIPKARPKTSEVGKSGGDATPVMVGIKRSRGRPKGSKNKVKKEPGAKIKPKGKVGRAKKTKKCVVDNDTSETLPVPSTDPHKDSLSSSGKPKIVGPKSSNQPKTYVKKTKKTKKVLASKVSKRKIALKPSGIKVPTKTVEERTDESESSEVELDSKKSLKGIKTVGKVAGTPYKPKSGGKSVSFPKLQGLKKEIISDGSDAEEKSPVKPPKKALKDKWSRELKKSIKTEETDSGKRGTTKGVSGRRRDYPPVCYEEESDHESEADDSYPRKSSAKIKKEGKSPGRKRKRKKIEDDDDEDDEDVDRPPIVVIPKRTARMASLNAIAMMACMNEDAKVPLPSLTQNEPPASSSSMALVLRESTIARRHSGDESEDSDDDFSDRGSSSSRKLDKRKSAEGGKDVKSKRKRRRRGELDVTMDMKDMVVTKRMASLNASAIMAASYSTEARNRRTTPHIPSHSSSSSRESEVTKISFKATKKQSVKTRSVITVQETTKKVKKAQTEGSTEVEEHIIVKKKVKHHRQSGVHVEEPTTPDSDHEILPKSPEEEEGADGDVDVDEARMILESSTTITYVTTQTHTVPGTVTLSGVREYSVSTSSNGGKTTTMMQQVQRKSITTTCTAGPVAASTSSTIPTAHIPPNQHIQVAAHEPRGPPSTRIPQNYSPLGALEVMQPVMHHPPPPPPPPPTAPHSSHYMPYPHPHHGSPIPHPHIHHHPPPGVHPPPMHINPHHHHIPHHPSSPYPPLSPHSPPYPPPPPSTTASTASSPPSSTTTTTCTSSPSTTPLPHPSPGSCPSFHPQLSFPFEFSPKQGASFRDDRPPPPPVNGPVERHHSAFTAPTPSLHSPAAPGSSHGYQPVSGPIPTGGSSSVGSYKPPQGSPGNSAATGPPYSSPSRLTSPPPSSPASKPHYSPVDHYSSASPHPYQPYPYPPPGSSSHYDKYYPRTPSYHLYQPPYSGGQYPPPGEYGPSQNATCCPAGSPKNVPSGPLTGGGKGPDTSCSSSSSSSSPTASDCNDTSKKQGPGNSACQNYHQYYSGSVPPQHKSQQVSNMASPTSPHPHFHHQQQPHSHHQSYSAKPKDIKDAPHQSSNENSPLATGNKSENVCVNHENNGKIAVDKRPCSQVPPLKADVVPNSVTVTPTSFSKDLGVKEGAKDVVPHSTFLIPVTSSSTSTSAPVAVTVPAPAAPLVVPISAVKTTTVTTSSVSTTFAAATTTTTSSERLTSQTPINSSPNVVSSLPSITTTSSVSSRGSLLAIATPLPVPTSTPSDSEEDKRKHTASPVNNSPKEEIKRIEEVHATSSASACTSVNGGALIPNFPTTSPPKTTRWVVQPSSASPTASISSTSTATNHQHHHHHRLHQSSGKNLADTATHYSYSSPTNNTISVSMSSPVLSSTNSVMSTSAPVVATLERISQIYGSKNQSSLPVVGVRQNFSDHSKGSERKDVHKEINNGSSSLQRQGRHLLCQPLPLSHTKVTSVLAKVKPSNSLGIRSTAEDTAKSHFKSNITEIINAASLPKLPKNDKCVSLPRKRGRPPKNKDADLLAIAGMEESMASSNGTPEGKHFCLAPGEVSGRDMSNKRMSVLKSSGATISPPRRLELQQEHRIKDMKEDMKINVKTEVPVGKIKSERVSPKQGFKEAKCKLLNGDSDIFNEMPENVLLKGTYMHPSLGIGNPDHQQELLKKKLKSETDFEDVLSRTEEKKIPKFGRPPKLVTGRIKGLGGYRIKIAVPKVRRKKASLLSYLKEKNESDTSIGEGEPTPPPPPSMITAMDDDIQKQKDEEAKKSPVRPSSFPSYNALSIRGRRSSGAGKGNKIQRKPKYNHGWSWIGEPHEGKVWLRNDEIWIVRKCYNAMRHKEGDTVRVRDCVLLRSGPRKTDLPYVAKVAALWEDPETSDMMMSILWYYRPEHTESGRREEDLVDEIFASKHRDPPQCRPASRTGVTFSHLTNIVGIYNIKNK